MHPLGIPFVKIQDWPGHSSQ